eukprot:CAMPEP_0184291392 /NCGR_PEP_ID=MMETSP1049-20130417/3447_1 /TAXON_ID=77928 /ORGANISM="Proteomonas sulcata, Strain CCMP704" /LENGTH=30 /DNA_ID= /DNA_START= /DNA_END= /DNA_ORIENTATION=
MANPVNDFRVNEQLQSDLATYITKEQPRYK